jgi:ABC-type multidrug transport system ATPase subunit
VGGDYLFVTAFIVCLFLVSRHALKLLLVLKTKAKAVLIDHAHRPMHGLGLSPHNRGRDGEGEDEGEDDYSDDSTEDGEDDDDVPGLFVERSEVMTFEFNELGLQLHSGVVALQGVSGAIKSHTLAAVMGPSGAGKTTFMNALCGRAYYGKVTGQVLINGTRDQILRHRKRVGFVPQDDIVHDDLTVHENLHFSAQLRLPRDGAVVPNGVRRARWVHKIVEDALSVLQIGHIRDSIVGSVEKRGISGGQRKRVNIGLELVADPVVLFLDEPTSGLDSHSSEVVLSALKEMTKLGLTVVTVIHQPRYSIFSQFDQVLLLGVGGRTVFSGPAANALPYFTSLGFRIDLTDNPADYFMDVISGERERFGIRQGASNRMNTMPTDLTEWPTDNSLVGVSFKPSELFDEWALRGSKWGRESRKHRLSGVWDKAIHPDAAEGVKNRPLTFKPKQINAIMALCDELDRQDGNYDGRVDITTLILFVDSLARPRGEGKHKGEESWTSTHIHALEKWLTPKLKSGVEEIVIADLEVFMKKCTKRQKLHRQQTAESLQRNLSHAARSSGLRILQESAGFEVQVVIMLQRLARQASAGNAALLLDFFVLIMAATLMGMLNGREFDLYGFHNDHMLVILFFGTLSLVGALKTFGTGQLIFWRESAAGVNPLSFFVAKSIADIPVLVLKPFLYTWVYCALTMPPSSWWDLPTVMLSLSWACSGWGYVLSIVLPPANATLSSVIFSIVMGAFLSGVKPELKGNPIRFFSFSYYALEGFCLTVYNYLPDHLAAQAYNGVATRFGWGGCDEPPCLSFLTPAATAEDPTPAPQLVGADGVYASNMPYLAPVNNLFVMGLLLRLLAGLLLIYTKRDRQVKPMIDTL